MKKNILAGLAFIALVTTACKKDNNTDVSTIISTTYSDLPADTVLGIGQTGPYGAGRYTFFNLATNSIVPNSDSATNKWDLAFAGTTVRINAGTSGPGAGGAFVYRGLFDELASVPTDSTFRIDALPSYAIPKGSGNGWYTYDGPNNIVTPIPGRVLVIKTGDGKFAKVEIFNYYKGGVTPAISAPDNIKIFTSRYYTFRYVYQSDGSMNF